MGKTYRRFDKDDQWKDVKKARAQQDDFHNRRQHSREVKEPDPVEDLGPVPPRQNKKLDAFKNYRISK